MKKQRNMPEYKGLKFDSQEELDFVYFLEDLNIPYTYQPESLILAEPVKETITVKLKTKEKKKEITLLQGCSYTADFVINSSDIDNKLASKLNLKKSSDSNYWIDIKANYIANNDDVKFSVIRKWVYQKHNIYINKVQPSILFQKTFCPDRCRYTEKTHKEKKCYQNCNNLSDFKKKENL